VSLENHIQFGSKQLKSSNGPDGLTVNIPQTIVVNSHSERNSPSTINPKVNKHDLYANFENRNKKKTGFNGKALDNHGPIKAM